MERTFRFYLLVILSHLNIIREIIIRKIKTHIINNLLQIKLNIGKNV